jgi:DNA-binding transcriptional ArsR family regulator
LSSPQTASAQLAHLRNLGLVKKEKKGEDCRKSYYSIADSQLKEYLDFNMRRMHPVL